MMNLDHFNIRTRKLAETVSFYQSILGLQDGPRPSQPLNGSWMYSGRQAVLHILDSEPTAQATGPLDHVAFACRGLQELLDRLQHARIARVARAIPGTNIVQVQFLDPNGVMVEANFTDEQLREPGDSMEVDGHTHFARLRAATGGETRRLEANGVVTVYEMHGSGPPLLLIHGAEADRSSFASVLPILSRCFTCIVYDQRDTSDTQNPPVDYTAADLADDAAAVIAAIGGKAHVWGNSYGGMIAQELALRHPARIDNLVLGVSFQHGATALAQPDLFMALRARQETDPGARLELLSLFFTPRTKAERPELIQGALGAFTRRDPDTQARRSRVTQQFDSRERLKDIRARTLVLGALCDRVISPTASMQIAREIPNATLTYLGDVGHAIALEAPERVARTITDFLRAGYV